MNSVKRIIFWISIIPAMLIIVYILIFLYNKIPIKCSSASALGKLFRIDLSNVEIVNIQYDIDYSDGYTDIVIYARTNAEYTNGEYFKRTNYSEMRDKNFEQIPECEIEMLAGNSLEISDIYRYGLSYSEIRNGMSDVPFIIRWYELNNECGEKMNLIFSTCIPRRVTVNI